MALASGAVECVVVSAPTRAAWLDLFRGLSMATMVVVNNPGGWNNVYSPLLLRG